MNPRFTAIARYGLIAFGMCLVFGLTSSEGGEERDAVRLVPDEDLQEQIERVVTKFSDTSLPPTERLAAIGTLVGVEQDDVKLFRQLFYYYSRHPRNDRKRLTAMLLIRYLDISNLDIIRGVLPYIEAEDQRLRSAARRFLEIVEGTPWKRCPDSYADFAAVLDPEPKGHQTALVAYLYENDPGCALLAILEGDRPDSKQSRAILWAEHVVSDAIWKKEQRFPEAFREAKPGVVEQLRKLSWHEQWWVRLYVAEVLHRHPELRNDEIVERLKRDEHRLVRKAIAPEEKKSIPRPMDGRDDDARDAGESLD